MILYVIVNITPLPRGTLSLFNLYVALSQCSGWNTISLLQDFDEEMFKRPHDPALLEEDERLEMLNSKTKEYYDKYIGL